MAVLLALLAVMAIGGLEMAMVYSCTAELQRAADAAVLAAAQGLIDGEPSNYLIVERAMEYASKNTTAGQPTVIDSIGVDGEKGEVGVRTTYTQLHLLFAPHGLTIRRRAKAKVKLTHGHGTQVPQGNAYGWWSHHEERRSGLGYDSASVVLVQ